MASKEMVRDIEVGRKKDSLQNIISMTSDEKTSEHNQSEEALNTEDDTPVPEVTADQPVVQPGPAPDLLSLVVIHLRLDMGSGEMVRDIEAGRKMVATDRGGWVEPDQQEVISIVSDSLEVFPHDQKTKAVVIT